MAKGSDLLREGRVLERDVGGKSAYTCNMEPDCTSESETLAGITRHVTGSHLRPKKTLPEKRKVPESEVKNVGGPTQRSKLNEDPNETTVSELARVGDTLDETTWSGVHMDTPTRPFSQSNLLANSTQVKKFDNSMEIDFDDGNKTLVPEVPSPNKAFRIEPSEEEMDRLFRESRYFYGEGSINLSQGVVEEPSAEDDAANLRKNHPYLYEDVNLESNSTNVMCSLCGDATPNLDEPGLHIKQHLEIVGYMPGLWKEGLPTCLTATVDSYTSRREMSSMVTELREWVNRYEIYYKESEDRNTGRKTAAKLLEERVQQLKDSLKAAEDRREENDEMATLLTSVADLQSRINELETEQINTAAQREKEQKHYLSRLQRAAEQTKAAKQLAANADNSKTEADSISATNKELSKNLSTAEFKLKTFGTKISELKKSLAEAVEKRETAENLYAEAKKTIEEYVFDDDKPAKPENTETKKWKQDKDGNYIFTRSSVLDGPSSRRASTNSVPKKRTKEMERCLYRDRKGGCKEEECSYLHLDNVCPDFMEKNCEKQGYSCTAGNHNRNDRFKLQAKESKAAAKAAKQEKKKGNEKKPQSSLPDNKVAVPLCKNWHMGACLAGIKGEMRCYAGAHIPEMKGKGAMRNDSDEDLTEGPQERLATAGPKFKPSQHPARGRGRGNGRQ